MKRNILILAMALFSAASWAQENMISISGGYSFANLKEVQEQGTGYNIIGTFELNPGGGKLVHGISFGYINLKATEGTGIQETKYAVNSFPVYYSPKYIFGENKIKPFIKGALGMQYAALSREAVTTQSTIDFGFFGGGGVGIMLFLKENFFINGEYDLTWASNSAYNDGWINCANGGIGFKF